MYHKDTQEIFEVSGPMSGMYLLEGGGTRKLVTPTTLRREYKFEDTEKAVSLYNSHIPQGKGKGVGWLIRKYIIEKIKELAPKEIEIWHFPDKKVYKVYNDKIIMVVRYSAAACTLFFNVDDIGRGHRKYIQRRFDYYDYAFMEAQIRFVMLDKKTKDIINLIIQDVIHSQKKKKEKETKNNG